MKAFAMIWVLLGIISLLSSLIGALWDVKEKYVMVLATIGLVSIGIALITSVLINISSL